MAWHFLKLVSFATALLSTSLAQSPSIIPSDFSDGFTKEVQVSFSSKAVNGFTSGSTFEKDAVTTEPTFALGDSNGISPSTRYTLIMVDTTCPNARKLHYVRTNFKFAFAGGTNLETSSPALLDYKAPGSLGEQGNQRQYIFLMYTNPQRREFAEMRLPNEEDTFDAKKFQGDNGLKDPVAGVGMVVNLEGTADCGGQNGNQVPSELPSSVSAIRSAIASATLRSSAAVTTQTASGSESPLLPSSTLSAGGEEQDTTSNPVTPTSVSTASSTALQSDKTEPTSADSIASMSSVRSSATGTLTTNSGLPEQTTNAAPKIPTGQGIFVAQLLMVAGVWVW